MSFGGSVQFKFNSNFAGITSPGEESMLVKIPDRPFIVIWITWCIVLWFACSRTPNRRIFLAHGAIFWNFRGNNLIIVTCRWISVPKSINRILKPVSVSWSKTALTHIAAPWKLNCTATSAPGTKCILNGQYALGCAFNVEVSSSFILHLPSIRTHIVVAVSTRATLTRTPSRNFLCVKCRMFMFHQIRFEISKNFNCRCSTVLDRLVTSKGRQGFGPDRNSDCPYIGVVLVGIR